MKTKLFAGIILTILALVIGIKLHQRYNGDPNIPSSPNANITRQQNASLKEIAEQFAALDPTEIQHSQKLAEFTKKYYANEPSNAVQWVLSLGESGGVFEYAYRSLGEAMVKSGNFQESINLVETIPSSIAADALFDGILIETARTDPELAIKLRLLSPELGSSTSQEYLLNLAIENHRFREAIAAVRSNFPKTDHPTEFRRIYRNWATAAPAEAAQDISNRPTSQAKLSGISGLVEGWSRISFTGARNWVDSLKIQPEKDEGLSALSRHLLTSNLPSEAFTMASQIANAKRRENVLQRIVSDWTSQDPDEASNAIQASNLPPHLKSLLTSQPKE